MVPFRRDHNHQPQSQQCHDFAASTCQLRHIKVSATHQYNGRAGQHTWPHHCCCKNPVLFLLWRRRDADATRPVILLCMIWPHRDQARLIHWQFLRDQTRPAKFASLPIMVATSDAIAGCWKNQFWLLGFLTICHPLLRTKLFD